MICFFLLKLISTRSYFIFTSKILPNDGLTAAFDTNISNLPYFAIVSSNKRLRSSALLT